MERLPVPAVLKLIDVTIDVNWCQITSQEQAEGRNGR